MRSGDDQAYEELYRRHAEAVRRYARTCCRDAHTADDLTAEVFARMLQAVRGGSGPEHAVRAYLLTCVRRVAAGWTRSAKREHLVEDFAVFAAQAARAAEMSEDDTLDLGADVVAMREAERSMAVRAFRSLPERWQAVLWHTEIEDESPSDVAALFGLDANGTRVLASRAREGLKRAYLQAHVSATLVDDASCARYADQLGTYARGRLRTRAERGVRKHLDECARCRLAAVQIEEVAGNIPAVVPVAVIGWFGAAGHAKAAALLAGGAGAGTAGTAGAAGGVGTAGGAGTAARDGSSGAPGAAGAANGGSSGGAAAVPQGPGAPLKAGAAAKAGSAAGVVAAAAVVVLALVGESEPVPEKPRAQPPVSAPAARPEEPAPAPSAPVSPRRAADPGPDPTPTPTRAPRPAPAPKPSRATPPVPPPPAPTPPPAPAVHQWNEPAHDTVGDGTGPETRMSVDGWVWQRQGLSIAGTRYAHGVTMRGGSAATIDLDRPCASYDAMAGVDDMTRKLGRVYFSVHGDGVPLWRSDRVGGGDPAVPVPVDVTGVRSLRLVVEPHNHPDTVALADWAQPTFTCD